MTATTEQNEPDESFIERSEAVLFPPPTRGLVQGLCTSATIACWLAAVVTFLTGEVGRSYRLLPTLIAGLALLHVWYPWRWIGRARLDNVDPDFTGRLVEVVLKPPTPKRVRHLVPVGQQPGSIHAGLLAIEGARLRFGCDDCRFTVHARDIAVIRNGDRFGPPRSFALATVMLKRSINGIRTIAIEPHRAATLPAFWFWRAVVLADLRPIRARIQTARALKRQEAGA